MSAVALYGDGPALYGDDVAFYGTVEGPTLTDLVLIPLDPVFASPDGDATFIGRLVDGPGVIRRGRTPGVVRPGRPPAIR